MATSSESTLSTPVTVLISGSGTNLQALLDAQSSSNPPFRIVRVISNRKAAYGLVRAQTANVPTTYHNLVAYKKSHESEDAARKAYDADLADLIIKDQPKLVVCAGFMHILSPTFLDPLEKAGVAIINLHPGTSI
jgi:phosphoribosylglycinamide formyltransferase